MLFSPRQSTLSSRLDLQGTQRIVLAACFVGSLCMLIATVALGDRFTAIACAVVCAVSAVCYFLSRRSGTEQALALTLLAATGTVVAGCYHFRGIHDVAAPILPVMILLAGLLLDRRFLWSYSALVISGAIGVVAARAWVSRVEKFDSAAATDLFLFVLTCALAAVVTTLLARQIERGYGLVQESESRYRRVYQNIQDAYFEIRPDGTLLELSPAAAELFGAPAESLIGTSVYAFCVDPAVHEEWLSALRQSGRISNLELVLRDRQGGLHSVLMTASWSEDPNRDRIVGSIRDITSRKRAEEAVIERERYLQAILQTTADGFCVVDRGGKVTEANDAFCRMSRYTRAEALALRLPDLEVAGAEVAARFQRLIPSGSEIFETRLRQKDGSVIDVEVSVSYLDTDGGRFVSFCRDITERKRAEQERVALEDQLRQVQKLEGIGRLTGGVAHEFNNLLTVVNGYSAFLLKALNLHDPLRVYAQQILKAGEHGADLTAQLLAYSRKQIIQPKPLNLGNLMKDMRNLLQRLVGEDVELVTVVGPDLGQVVADPVQIHQVLMNLASNARDAMPDGGKLTIEAANIEIDENFAATHAEATPGQWICLSVADSGTGMDKATRERLFEPFFTTKEQGKGTGLGLATIHGIVHQIGGWIDVESEPGQGACFRTYLPRTDACAALGSDAASGAEVLAGSETVLLVEDQKAVRKLGKTILTAHGYRVLEAANGAEAIRLANGYAGAIHLLMTDVVMPGMNGRELAGKLKAARPETKVLFMSGYTADATEQRGVVAEGAAFLPKPFSPDSLAMKVREVLAGAVSATHKAGRVQ